MKKARRVLLKVSGEWFSGNKEKGFDEKTFESLAKSLVEAKRKNIQVLSLGTSSDYKDCIKAGSNLIRVGEILFGRRL